MRKGAITADVVVCLLAEQFPRWAHLPVSSVELDGWDNTTFRVGDGLSVRLPSADGYVSQVEKEHRWLPVLAPQLPLSIPEPLAKGVPGCGFPRPWSVYRWLEGAPVTRNRMPDLSTLAADLAEFLVALYAIDPAGGPVAGEHSAFRGAPPSTYNDDVHAAILALGDEIDSSTATAVWEAALASPADAPDVWVHGDVTGANLLVVDGRLTAVIDFGCCAIGDPACDLAIAWTLFHAQSRRVFHDQLAPDDRAWSRGRGWALWKAVITLAKAPQTNRTTSDSASAAFGWRVGARNVIDEILTEFVAAQ